MPHTPPGPCTTPGCPNLKPCPTHQTKPWANPHQRRHRTLTGSAEQKRTRRILRRDNYRCHICGQDFADEADHIIPLAEGGNDDDTNLAAIHHTPCHIAKTKAEAARGRARARGESTSPRPAAPGVPPRHPEG